MCLGSLLPALAQERPPFNPEKFQADMERFITTEACLTPSEAARFFPLFREMQAKQRARFAETMRMRHIDTSDNAACYKAIVRQDQLDIEIKKLQQRYHMKFLKVLSPGKVMAVIKAEERFHRQAFWKAMKRRKAEKNHR